MISAHSTALANKLSRLFDAQGIEALCSHYTFPLPVQIDGVFHLFQSPQDLRRAFAVFCSKRKAEGLTDPAARVVATELPRNGRFRIWLDWTFTEAASQSSVRKRTVYYCSMIGHRTAIDMIACSEGVVQDPSAITLRRQFA
ncbi:MAG: hypothetical protein ACRC6I_03590 [Paracoccaceae bacterium]